MARPCCTGPLRVGVIGCGGIAQMMHLPHLAERPDLFEIVALADIDAPTLEAVGKKYHVGRLHGDHRLLLREDLEAVLVLSGGSHARTVIDALQQGRHVFVEKPLGESLQEVEAVAAAAQRAGVTLMVGYHKRYDPGYELAQSKVRGLRDLRLARVEVLHPVDARAREHHVLHPPPDPLQAARQDSEETDGLLQHVLQGPARQGVQAVLGHDASAGRQVATFLLFQSLVHDVNALRGILGEPDEVLAAELWRGGRCMHIVLGFGETVRATLSWIYLPGLEHYKEELLFVSPESRVTLSFPSPYFRHFPTPVTVELMEQGHMVKQEITAGLQEAFRAELHHFYGCIKENHPPRTGIEDALADTRIIERIARAFQEARK